MLNGSRVRKSRSKSVPRPNGAALGHNVNNNNNPNVNNINLWKLLLLELNIDSRSKKKIDTVTTSNSKDISMTQLLNVVKIPIYLERFMVFGLLYSTNAFLTLITIVPLRIVIHLFLLARKSFVSRKRQHIKANTKIFKRDAIYIFSVMATLFVLKEIDTSKIYHNIKNGTAIKLYVMMGILEVADKLLSSLGQDLLNILFNLNLSISFKNIIQFYVILFLSVCYLSCHSYVFIYQIMSLTVLINSYSNALLTLILSAQFSELKSSVFKKFEREGLFQISCADLVERFQLFTILFIISLKNLNIENNDTSLKPNSWYMNSSNYINIWFGIIMGPTFVVIGSEIMVDWLKHLYITKFNKIKPTIYEKYMKVLSIDYMESYKNSPLFTGMSSDESIDDDNNLDGILLVRRIGLPLLTMIIAFIKMSIIPLCSSILTESHFIGATLITICFITTLFLRLVLTLILLKWSNSVMCSGNRSLLHDFVSGSPSTSLVELNNGMRKHLYDTDEQVPPSLEEIRNTSILKLVAKKRKLSTAGDYDADGREDDEVQDDKYDNLMDVRRYEMASKRIW